jgi:type I restriction enzyme M protein
MVTGNQNKFCKLSNLRNESDVEQSFLRPLLEELGYTEDYIETKATIPEKNIGKKRKPKLYRPDFICYGDKQHYQPLLVIDAKHPSQRGEDGLADAQLYVAVIRRSLKLPKPDQYCIGSNGIVTVVKHYDSDKESHYLDFIDFKDNNQRFIIFKSSLSRSVLAATLKKETSPIIFEFQKPAIPSLIAIFEACHNLIWRREKCPPADAFYEFAKILFVKLRKDKDLHKKAQGGLVVPEGVEVSVRWIESLESADPNPFNSILFANLRNGLEEEIRAGTKKRMFEEAENIRLKPNTIKEVVRLLEHHDLYSIDEDLNGRMFETFLTAVIRGRSLGQYFTPRTVVKFMVDISNLSISRNKMPRILDACCGTGGFLIEAMARLTDSISNNQSLSNSEKVHLLKKMRTEHLWGIEANETIARIARINMYLHQDGGSRIYKADSLDKEFTEEPNIVGEPKRDFDELRHAILSEAICFDVVLTNPPFAMRYEAKKKDEKIILQQYNLARLGVRKGIVSSLRSSIMFLERYYDLLRNQGFLLTIIDDSALNTSATKSVRQWIKERFYIRAIISLPKNCFVVAGSSSKTSILFLEKKPKLSDDQPTLFMAKSRNVGHSDSGKSEIETNDLPAILAEWNRFRENGTLPTREGCFVVKPENLMDRLDVQWYDPEYLELYQRLDAIPHFRVGSLKPELKYGASIDADYKSDIPFIRIENLRRNDIDLSALQYIPSAIWLKQLKSLFLKEGDVLIARSGTYVGLCAVVGSGLEGFVYGSYIIRLRLRENSKVLPRFLALYFNSRFGQMQFDRLKTGSLQFNINKNHIQDIVVPELSIPDQEKMIAEFSGRLSQIKAAKQNVAVLEAQFSDSLGSRITSTSGIKGPLRLRDFLGI